RDLIVTGVQTCALPIFGRRTEFWRRTGWAGSLRSAFASLRSFVSNPSVKDATSERRRSRASWLPPRHLDRRVRLIALLSARDREIGRASCRERVWRGGG